MTTALSADSDISATAARPTARSSVGVSVSAGTEWMTDGHPDAAVVGRLLLVGAIRQPGGQPAGDGDDDGDCADHGQPVAPTSALGATERVIRHVDHRRPVADPGQLLPQLLGAHDASPISSASSGARVRSRANAWRVVDLTVPAPMPSTWPVCTSVRSSK